MAVCKPNYAIGTTSLSTIPDFDQFLEQNPANLFNSTELTTLNTLNNILLKKADLSKYPNLQKRVNQGSITDQEFADFIVDAGYDIDYIKNAFIDNFPVQIDYKTVRALFDESTQVTNVTTGTGVTGTGVTGTGTGTTTTGTGVTGTGTFNTGSGNDFIIDTGSNISRNPDTTEVIVNVGENVENPNWDVSNEINGILVLQNKYFDPLLFNASTCAALANPFAKVIGALSALQDLAGSLLGVFGSIQDLVNDIKSYGSLSGIIQGLQQKLTSFVDQLKNTVLNLADQALAQVTAIADRVSSFFQQVAYLPQQVYNFLYKKIGQVRDFFKPENMKKLQDKIQKFFDNMLNQFEDKLPNALNYFLLIACGLSNLLQEILNAPVEKLNTTVSSVIGTHDILAGYSTNTRNTAVQAGAIRTTPEQRKREAKRGVENNNRAAEKRNNGVSDSGQWSVPSGYVSADITNEDLAELNQMNFDGFPGALSFTAGVNTMGKRATARFESASDPRSITKTFPKFGNTYYGDIFNPERNLHNEDTREDAGWKMIVDKNPGHWVRLIRVAKRLQRDGHLSGTLQVNSAYRSPFYNYFMVNGAEYSNHMEGKAFDVSHVNLNDEGEAAFIRACSEEGFTRIVRYNSFYHIDDDGPRSTYWNPPGKSLLPRGTQARAAWDAHAAGVYQRS